jgi:NAD(P)H-hydrate repair Nnr-like enzyme with NAD(P)H-hydrate dehydratase domain
MKYFIDHAVGKAREKQNESQEDYSNIDQDLEKLQNVIITPHQKEFCNFFEF